MALRPILSRIEDLIGAGTRGQVIAHDGTRFRVRRGVVYDVRDYGAAGDGATDDTAALQACADAAEAGNGTFYLPPEFTCRITSQLDLRYVRRIEMQGVIRVAHTSGVGVLAGDTSAQARGRELFFNEVIHAGTQSNVALRLVGLKNGKVTVHRCSYLQLYADANDATMSSIAYSTFRLGYVPKVELLGENGTAWINSNRFYCDRLTTLIVDGTYNHNHNRFIGPTFEASTITFNAGSSNVIEDARGEGGATITFGADTWLNKIIFSWYSNPSAIWPFMTITDTGFGNQVLTERQRDAVPVTIFRVDSASRTTDTCSEWLTPHATRRIHPGFRNVTMPNSATEYLDTGIFPLEMTSPAVHAEGSTRMRSFRFQSDTTAFRLKVFVYDANRQPLDGSSTDYMNLTGGWVWITDSYRFSTDVQAARIVFDHPDVQYARFVLYGHGSGSDAAFGYAELIGYAFAPFGPQLADLIQRQMRLPLYQTGTTPPTKSLLHKGDSIGTDTGRLLVTHRVDTTLSVAAVATDTTITVASATGISTGDNIAVLLDDDTTHFTTVNGAPAGNVVTLTAAMPSGAAIGNTVATQRWLHLT